MSLFGAIGRTAFKSIHSNNRFLVRHAPQTPDYVSTRFSLFSTTSKELENKIPERPKRPHNSYNAFFKSKVAELKAGNPQIVGKDMAKTIADQWKNLDPYVKRELIDKSKEEGQLYKQEIEKWRKSLNETQMSSYMLSIRSRRQNLAKRRLKMELKRLEYPERPKSAFNFYIKEALNDKMRPTDEPLSETFKKTVAKWKTLTPEEKYSYIESAKNDKMRYIQELNEWQENLKTPEQKDSLDRLTKLRTLSSRSSLNPDLKKEKTKKVVKKKRKTMKLKTKTSKKIRAKPKVKSKSKSKTTAKKSKSKKSSKPKSSEKKSESKTKTRKEGSRKKDSSDSSDE